MPLRGQLTGRLRGKGGPLADFVIDDYPGPVADFGGYHIPWVHALLGPAAYTRLFPWMMLFAGALLLLLAVEARLYPLPDRIEAGAALGIPEGLIRYSVGIEDATDIVKDLETALAAV